MSASHVVTVPAERSREVEVVAKSTRRRCTVDYKVTVLQEADACHKPGEIGALLRREGLYCSNLTVWREPRRTGALAGLAQKKRGPAPHATHPLAARVAALEKETRWLNVRAERAEALVELQKSLHAAGDRTAAERRDGLMAVVAQQRTGVGIAPACTALSVARATFYRRQTPTVEGARPLRRIPRALPPDERMRVLALLNEDRFVDHAPAQVYATLLDEGMFLCSIPTMYRILRANRQVRERRNQRRHPSDHKPELLATRPNHVWSWDITTLLGPVKWTYFHLYVILDIFSRYVTGWMLAPRESAALAQRLIDETCATQGILPGQLFLHADRGTSMTSKPVAWLLADLGVTRSHSRPQVSNDNPFSEASSRR